jgi:hypothetical protein
MALTVLFSSMRSSVHSSKVSCRSLAVLRGLAMGTKYWLIRRSGTIVLVMPCSSKRKCRAGSSKGELMTGFSMTTCDMVGRLSGKRFREAEKKRRGGLLSHRCVLPSDPQETSHPSKVK